MAYHTFAIRSVCPPRVRAGLSSSVPAVIARTTRPFFRISPVGSSVSHPARNITVHRAYVASMVIRLFILLYLYATYGAETLHLVLLFNDGGTLTSVAAEFEIEYPRVSPGGGPFVCP